MRTKVLDQDTLIIRVKELKNQGKIIISTSGCFDILHAGHVTYLEDAKQRGDILVVLLNSDYSVQSLKGKGRPIMPEQERAVVLSGLEAVDYVCLFEEETPCDLIKKFQPDVVIKGGDYSGMYIPEIDVVNEYGGEVLYASMVEGCSSTNIIKKIREGMEK